MMFIVRNTGEAPQGIAIKLSRAAPAITGQAGKTDFFCVAEPDAITALRDNGAGVIDLHDGYYEDGKGGGVAIWGQGKYWEIRDTPFTVKEAVGPTEVASGTTKGEHVEVRRAIFGA
jgi:hypothetical protein